MDSYTLVNVNGGYEFNNFKIEAYVKNAGDKLYDTNNFISNSDGDRATRIGTPCEARCEINLHFLS